VRGGKLISKARRISSQRFFEVVEVVLDYHCQIAWERLFIMQMQIAPRSVSVSCRDLDLAVM
jgi:hypothetical protein